MPRFARAFGETVKTVNMTEARLSTPLNQRVNERMNRWCVVALSLLPLLLCSCGTFPSSNGVVRQQSPKAQAEGGAQQPPKVQVARPQPAARVQAVETQPKPTPTPTPQAPEPPPTVEPRVQPSPPAVAI